MTKEELTEIKSWVAENMIPENGFDYVEVKEVDDSGRYTVNFLYDTLNPKAVKTLLRLACKYTASKDIKVYQLLREFKLRVKEPTVEDEKILTLFDALIDKFYSSKDIAIEKKEHRRPIIKCGSNTSIQVVELGPSIILRLIINGVSYFENIELHNWIEEDAFLYTAAMIVYNSLLDAIPRAPGEREKRNLGSILTRAIEALKQSF
jgi:hypothetical protein